MKTEEDEAFDDLAKKQSAWGGGFKAKQAMAADKLQEPAHCQCTACKDGILHASDCAVHNGPAYPAGPCDCGVAQEPVAYLVIGPYEKQAFADISAAQSYCNGLNKGFGEDVYIVSPLNTTPPQRPWVGLTDDELADLWYKESLDWMEFACAHEAALKEKNFD
jgi:hypothetical protein